MIAYFFQYLKARIFFALIGFYAILAVMLKSYTSLDITVPCLFNFFLGIKCWGCGLTTAATKVARFDLIGAFQTNPLSYIVLPAFTVYLFLDILEFRKNTVK